MDTKISEALKINKNIMNVFSSYKLLCAECKGISQDTVRIVIRNNGLDGEKFLKELNDACK
ncbi:MAG: hypothetical protein JW982_03160 [Spirochaetes bacterium]|nr:hypothetical protein [Spirochaetota bacterium]